jgi:hypothetical protein
MEVGQPVARARGRDGREAAECLSERSLVEVREGVIATRAQVGQSLGLGVVARADQLVHPDRTTRPGRLGIGDEAEQEAVARPAPRDLTDQDRRLVELVERLEPAR